ncbi:hypothetical protein B0A48_02939 [Cryoendolithus antarcticus]|uniref:JmjC domain-containing protein n=1 Tax=Cryoendolithus antarcticus TaxID=1507870 RepID=A0A1V8TM42_9PEZI|nr:hypothetical protein B0A48_02939 [Cryoendolithus antarcticus]
MLARQACRRSISLPRGYVTKGLGQQISRLPIGNIETFREVAFTPSKPCLLPRNHFANISAVTKWFTSSPQDDGVAHLNTRYLSRFGSTIVPLEITNEGNFTQIQQSLSLFLECVTASTSTFIPERPNRYFSGFVPGARAIRRTNGTNDFFSASTLTAPTARVYLAQASLSNLPQALRDDVPTPDLVLKAGRGDLYETSIWLGQAPTYTPLHRDPNPNLFVQLAGCKEVRLFPPATGKAIFAYVQEQIGGHANATMRGEEMMQGAERKALEAAVWGEVSNYAAKAQCAELEAGDGLFIPKGWWHSVRGTGEGMTGSVNWWFR